jgi:hypothetical protein
MKKFLFIIGLILWASFFQGQNNQDVILTCEDVAENCAELFVHYYKADNMDSVAIILDYWGKKCGNTEPIQRAHILFAIDRKQYSDVILKPGILEKVLDYKEKETAADSEKNRNEFDIFTKQFAASMMGRYSKSGISYAWCEFYGKDAERLLKRIQNHEFDESTLAQEYFAEVEKLKINGNFHVGVLAGAWIPFGELAKLGTHPEVGYSVGGCFGRFNFDIIAGYRFLNTADMEIQYKDVTVKTESFSGYFLGIDASVSVLRKRQNELLCAGGFGYENFKVVRNKEIPNMEANYLNIGLAYRRYFQHNFYLGIQLKYNMMHYLSGSPFNDSGNVLLTRVSFGWMSGSKKAQKLSRLQYDY